MQRRVAVRVHHVQIALHVAQSADELVVLVDHRQQKRRVASTVAQLRQFRAVLQTQQRQVLRRGAASNRDMQTRFLSSFRCGLREDFEIRIEAQHGLHERDDLLGRHVLLRDGLIVVLRDHHQDMAGREAFAIDDAHARSVLQESHGVVVIAQLEREVQRRVEIALVALVDVERFALVVDQIVHDLVQLAVQRDVQREIAIGVLRQHPARVRADLAAEILHVAFQTLVEHVVIAGLRHVPVQASIRHVRVHLHDLARQLLFSLLNRQRQHGIVHVVALIDASEVHVAQNVPRHGDQTRLDREVQNGVVVPVRSHVVRVRQHAEQQAHATHQNHELHGVLVVVVADREVARSVQQRRQLHLALLVHLRRQQRDRQRDIVRLRRVVRQLLELAVGAQPTHLLHLAEVAQVVQDVELEPVVALRRQPDVGPLHELQQLLRGHQSLLHHELPAQQAVGLRSLREKPDRFVDVMVAKKIVEHGLGVHSAVAAIHVGADGDQSR